MQPAVAGGPPPSPPDGGDERANVLIVDDLPEKLLVFRTVLEDLGQNLVFVQSGRAALREILQREFAVILLDVNMPDIDGFETASLIREHQRSAHTPIIFITSFADEIQTARGYSLGAVDYILSPVVPEVLRSKVRVFVSLHNMRRQVRRQADDRAAMVAAQAARQVAERSDRRSELVSQASRAMGETLDAALSVERLCRLLVPRLARVCAVQLFGDEGEAAALATEDLHVAFRADPNVDPHVDPHAGSAAPAQFTRVRQAQLAAALQTALRQAHDGRRRPGVSVHAGLRLSLASFGVGAATPRFAEESFIATPLVAGPRPLGVMLTVGSAELDGVLLEDLGSRLASALENARLYKTLQAEIVERRAAEAELQRASRLKDEFLAMLSHELRNPLAAVHSALQLVHRRTDAEPGIAWATGIMDRQLGQMTRLIVELLDVARISQDKIVLAREAVTLSAVIDQSVESAQPFLRERDQTLTLAMPREAVHLEGDFARLTQILTNLLHNASKYSGPRTLIELRCEVGEGQALVAVRDHGIGIEPELLPRIFDLFAQGSQGLDRSQGGLGVGLTLARRLAQLHGGDLEARSEGPGRGAEFRLTLPRRPRPALPPDDASAEAADRAESAAPARVRRVLVVDDNTDAALALATLLELDGHLVRVAGDGAQALACLEAFTPEVAILDIGLPGIDGYELARRLRRMPALEGLLLLALTGYGQQQDHDAARQAGFDRHFVKPVDPGELTQCIAAA